jgi:hypothetical protein
MEHLIYISIIIVIIPMTCRKDVRVFIHDL